MPFLFGAKRTVQTAEICVYQPFRFAHGIGIGAKLRGFIGAACIAQDEDCLLNARRFKLIEYNDFLCVVLHTITPPAMIIDGFACRKTKLSDKSCNNRNIVADFFV